MDENDTDILDVYYIVSDQISIVLLIKKKSLLRYNSLYIEPNANNLLTYIRWFLSQYNL